MTGMPSPLITQIGAVRLSRCVCVSVCYELFNSEVLFFSAVNEFASRTNMRNWFICGWIKTVFPLVLLISYGLKAVLSLINWLNILKHKTLKRWNTFLKFRKRLREMPGICINVPVWRNKPVLLIVIYAKVQASVHRCLWLMVCCNSATKLRPIRLKIIASVSVSVPAVRSLFWNYKWPKQFTSSTKRCWVPNKHTSWYSEDCN